MKDLLQLIKMNKWAPFYLLHSLFFNLKYLPFKQAIKLPILLYKPRFLNLQGSIVINGTIKTGMIKIGFFRVPIYPDKGCVFQIAGNIIFEGNAKIGNDSKMCIGEKGCVIFGKNFNCTAGLKLVCNSSVTFEDNVLIGWENLILDYDFHKVSYVNSNNKEVSSLGYAPILIGHDSWLANKVSVYKGVTIPPHSIVASGTTLTRSAQNLHEYCLIGSTQKTSILKEGIWWNILDDKIMIN